MSPPAKSRFVAPCKLCPERFLSEIDLLLHFGKIHYFPNRDLFKDEEDEDEDNEEVKVYNSDDDIDSKYKHEEILLRRNCGDNPTGTLTLTLSGSGLKLKEKGRRKEWTSDKKKKSNRENKYSYYGGRQSIAKRRRSKSKKLDLEDNNSSSGGNCNDLTVSSSGATGAKTDEEKDLNDNLFTMGKILSKGNTKEEPLGKENVANTCSFGPVKENIIVKETKKKEESPQPPSVELTCVFCGTTLNSVEEFMNHARGHTRESPYFCKYCDESFPLVESLTNHVSRTHLNRCVVCQNDLKTLSSIKEHMTAHKRNSFRKPFECKAKACGKRFQFLRKYQRHLFSNPTHLAGKPVIYQAFQCSICDRPFAQLRILRNHVEKQHLARGRFGCFKCGKVFKKAHRLGRHEILDHGIHRRQDTKI